MELFIGIFGLLIALATFYYSFFKKSDDELNHLKAIFRATQTLSISVQESIEEYTNKSDSWDKLMFSDVTFRDYLIHMKDSYKENLSEGVYTKLSTMKFSKANIQSMTNSIEQQFSELQKIKAGIKIKLNQL